MSKFIFVFLILLSCDVIFSQQQPPCTLDSNDSHLILRIVESNGDQISQATAPEDLAIAGVPGEDISLDIVPALDGGDGKERLFRLDGKRLKLVQPLDRDPEDLSSVTFQVTCTDLNTGRRRTIPVVVAILDLNDNAPTFKNTPYVLSVPENVTVGSVVFRGLEATDPDSNVNGQVEYRVTEDDGVFDIDLPHQGLLTVKKPLDYETTKRHYVTIVASDRAVDKSNRFSATTTLVVNVLDSDDQNPEFAHSLYEAKVTSGLIAGALEVRPEKIRAEDQDSLRTEVVYSFESGNPNSYSRFFTIDPDTGIVSQKASVDISDQTQFEITVKAAEKSPKGRFATSKLVIKNTSGR